MTNLRAYVEQLLEDSEEQFKSWLQNEEKQIVSLDATDLTDDSELPDQTNLIIAKPEEWQHRQL